MNILSICESLDVKGVEAFLAEEKKLPTRTSSYDVAVKDLQKFGYTDVITHGGENWNISVANQLSYKFGKKVILVGPSPLYNEDMGIFRFTSELNTNKEAAILLSQEWE